MSSPATRSTASLRPETTARRLIRGNFIGTDATGTQALGNFTGIALFTQDVDGAFIGGPGTGNLVSGNASRQGVLLAWDRARSSTGNPNRHRTSQERLRWPNGLDGIEIGEPGVASSGNRIGGPSAGQGTSIAFNGRKRHRRPGRRLSSGNWIRRKSHLPQRRARHRPRGWRRHQANDDGDGDSGGRTAFRISRPHPAP